VTVNVCVPDGRGVTIAEVPVPEIVTPPGLLVRVHVPVNGNPLNTTLPVDISHVGLVIIPAMGELGAEGWGLIKTFAEGAEVQPSALVTIKL